MALPALSLWSFFHAFEMDWEPACWTFILASAAEAEDARAFVAFLHSVQRILPCPQARERLRAYLAANPPEDAAGARAYCSDLHAHLFGPEARRDAERGVRRDGDAERAVGREGGAARQGGAAWTREDAGWGGGWELEDAAWEREARREARREAQAGRPSRARRRLAPSLGAMRQA